MFLSHRQPASSVAFPVPVRGKQSCPPPVDANKAVRSCAGCSTGQDGIPADPGKKVEIAKRIIDKADKYGVALKQLHIDSCVMALATTTWVDASEIRFGN